jgi:uncharacterized membrane protein YeiH
MPAGSTKLILDILEYIGIFAFAISGAFVAMEKKMDLFGTFVLALVTAVGGGVLRDVIMNIGVPKFFSSYLTILLALAAAVITMATKGNLHWSSIVLVCDAVGLSVFSINTGVKSILMGYNLPEVLFTSVITGVGGGVLRDICAQRIPVIFQKEIYASASIAGVLVLWFTCHVFGMMFSTYLSLFLIFLLRMLSVRHGVNLPVVRPKH